MQVQSSSINFASEHQLVRREHRRSLIVERPTPETVQQPVQESVAANPVISSANQAVNTSSIFARNFQSISVSLHSGSVSGYTSLMDILDSSRALDARMKLRKALIEAMTGISVMTFSQRVDDGNRAKKISSTSETDHSSEPPVSVELSTDSITPTDSSRVFFQGSLINEYELTAVTIEAGIVDKEGRRIDISLQVQMERNYRETEAELRIRATQQLKDPLVINFNGDVVSLSQERVSFDIDSDGISDLIPSLLSNSAYIALDSNGDGTINNGSELFGTSSGNGFAELAQYDEDGNGFIDSGDSVFSKLVAYSPATNTSKSIASLGVSALSLQSVQSPFRITDEGNNTLGQLRSTGFYLMDNGTAGSLQQIDLAV